MEGRAVNEAPKFEVVACIAGRGFQGAPRGYEEAFACNAREGFHTTKRRASHQLHTAG
jgi:hypothetical protein